MLSSTLKERLNQYKSLKEEEERNAVLSAVPATGSTGTHPMVDPPIQNEEGGRGSQESAGEPGNDEENVSLEGNVLESPLCNTEITDQEELDGNSQDLSNGAVDDDEIVVEDSFDDTSFHEGGKSDQDVFRALDEAERADSAQLPPDEGKREDLPENGTSSTTKVNAIRRKQKCINIGLILVSCVAIVAIVLPFFIDYRPQEGNNLSESNPTVAPTIAPTTLRWGQFLKTFLIPTSGEKVFLDKNSPQYRAAMFILDDAYTSELASTELLEDRYASATFYFATNGENWNSCYFGDSECEEGQWLVGDVCDWYAVSCNDNGRVSSFTFAKARGNGLVGSLPHEMSLLSAMTDLVIVNNTITGTLPEAFGEHATSLRSILLPDNMLTGSIPMHYLSNSPLEVVHLGNNLLSGALPTKIGHPSYLQQLDLSGNSLTGTISNFLLDYQGLEALSLANNELIGTVSSGFYAMKKLRFLHLNGNKLSGTISSSFGSMTSLTEFVLHRNDFSGSIPESVCALRRKNLEILTTDCNKVGCDCCSSCF